MTSAAEAGADLSGLPTNRNAPTSRHMTPIARLVGALAIFALVGCRQSTEPISLSGETMGTTYSIKLAALPHGMSPSLIKSSIDTALAEFDEQMSTWRPDSELSRFNASESTDWFPVSTATATVVTESQRISRESGGAFDVTVLPLVDLWSFGPEGRLERIPNDDEIAAVQEYVGYEKLDVRLDPPAMKKVDPRVSVDLSAIAPGYAADLIAESLDERGVSGYMIELGGEIRTKGTKADGTPWRIGIEKPLTERRIVERIVELSGESLGTSGDYRHFFEIDGIRYPHTIDPRTGKPVRHNLTSVTLMTDSCMAADGYATAVMVLGPEEGYNWLVERDIPGLLFLREGDTFIERATPAFEADYAE